MILSDDLAKELQRELSGLMMYPLQVSNERYSECVFCLSEQWKLGEEIDHEPDCLGMRLMKELDGAL